MKSLFLLSLRFALTAALSFSLLFAAQATVRYVKEGGSGTGASWADASGDLQAMIDASADGDTIWVAAGTYKPTSTNDRNISFSMKSGVVILGGFPNTDTPGLSDRHWIDNPTILSGNIGDPADNSDNSYSVISNSNVNSDALLDGFTISGGKATKGGFSPVGNSGGGMFNASSDPTLTNCSFSGNSARLGGGMYNVSSDPILTNCSFSGNSASEGGGMYNASSDPILTNCSFSGNSASEGGGMYNDSSDPILTNCDFSENSADRGGGMFNIPFFNNPSSTPILTNCSFSGNSASEGGGMYNQSDADPILTNCSFSGNSADLGGGMFNTFEADPILTNCSFSGNSASEGGGMYNANADPNLTNCILWGNTASSGGPNVFNTSSSFFSSPSFSYSIIQGSGGSDNWNPNFGTNGGDNLDQDPLFVDAATGDLRLQAGSPAIDAGNNGALPMGVSTDLAGNPRIDNGTVDLGAFEYQTSQELQLLNGANDLACGGDFFFPFTEPGNSSDRLLTIRNEGNGPLEVLALSLGGDGVFTIQNSPALPLSIPAGQQQVLTLRFSPTAGQAYSGTLTLTNTDTDEGICVINLSATAVIPTMGQWAFFLFGLIVFGIGLVGVYNLKRHEGGNITL